MPDVVPITTAHAALYREVRLEALADSPSAFGSTYAREAAFTEDEWLRRSASLDGMDRAGFIAMDAGHPCGLVACFREEQEPSRAHVIAMWVSPAQRGAGLGRSLLNAIGHWAQSRGIRTLVLMVTNNNYPAIALYEHVGFAMTGRTEPYPNDATLTQLEMAKSLANDNAHAENEACKSNKGR